MEELEAAIGAARGDQGQRQAWDRHNAEGLAAGRLAAEELAGREREALLALEQDPPQHLTGELGRPPTSHAGRKAWRQGARLIEQYRTRHEVDDPTRPFGEVPKTRPSRRSWPWCGRGWTGSGTAFTWPPPSKLRSPRPHMSWRWISSAPTSLP